MTTKELISHLAGINRKDVIVRGKGAGCPAILYVSIPASQPLPAGWRLALNKQELGWMRIAKDC